MLCAAGHHGPRSVDAVSNEPRRQTTFASLTWDEKSGLVRAAERDESFRLWLKRLRSSWTGANDFGVRRCRRIQRRCLEQVPSRVSRVVQYRRQR